MLNSQDLTNILALVKIAPIKGEEAITVAVLQQKLFKMLEDAKASEPKETNSDKTTA